MVLLKSGKELFGVVILIILFVIMHKLNSIDAKLGLPRQSSPFSSIVKAASESTSNLRVPIENGSPTMRNLSGKDTFFPEVKSLYSKYGSEIASFRPKMREWCKKTQSCKFCDYEVEMMFMLIREHKPQKVFEMAPNKGYSTHWILQALTLNDDTSHLHSFDIHDRSVESMDKELGKRWTFTKGDYAALLDSGKLKMQGFDFIFIDALHTEEFSRGYCEKILRSHKEKAIVAIHDIVADKNGGGRESSEVYKYMAFDAKVSNVFTMSSFHMPSLSFPMKNAILQLNRVREQYKIVKPCANNKECSSELHDPLYFENGSSPAIFFEFP